MSLLQAINDLSATNEADVSSFKSGQVLVPPMSGSPKTIPPRGSFEIINDEVNYLTVGQSRMISELRGSPRRQTTQIMADKASMDLSLHSAKASSA